MARHTRILTCTDFSDASAPALRRAAALAADGEAEILLTHVINPSAFIPPQAVVQFSDESVTAVKDSLRKQLDETRATLFADLPAEKVKTAILSHPSAASAITEYADEEAADLIVIGSHGRTGLTRMLIGSVAEKVVRHAHCDVLVVRSNAK